MHKPLQGFSVNRLKANRAFPPRVVALHEVHREVKKGGSSTQGGGEGRVKHTQGDGQGRVKHTGRWRGEGQAHTGRWRGRVQATYVRM